MSIESSFIILFCVATAVAIAVRRVRVPYTVALVLAGLGLGALQIEGPPHLTKDLLFAIFLPGLLFEAAFHLDFDEFRKNWIAIASLAFPGVVGAIAITAGLATVVIQLIGVDPAFSWQFGLVFGALIAATDPVAVTALFRQVQAPRRLSILVEGESLLNDGTAIVFLTLILASISGAAPSGAALVGQFITVTGGGAMVGIAIGVVISQLIIRIDEPMIEITLTTIAAYGSFVLGEQLHVSGVIATVTAGMLCGNYGRRVGMSPATRVAVETFWEYVAFALNSIVFLLIGLEVRVGALVDSWAVIAVGYAAVLFARIGVVFVVTFVLRGTRERISGRSGAVLAWGGLRGALSMVLALALPADFPHRDLLVTMTVGVVLLSLLVQGVTIAPLLERLGFVGTREDRRVYDIASAHAQAATAAIAEIDRMARHRIAPPDVLADLRARCIEAQNRAERVIGALHVERGELRNEIARVVVRHLLMVERDRLSDAFRDGTLAREPYDVLTRDLAGRSARLERKDIDDPAVLLVGESPGAAEPTDPAGSVTAKHGI